MLTLTTTQTDAQTPQHTHSPLHTLTATQLRLLDEIAFLARTHSRTAPRGGKWCQPSRRYLAEKTGRSIWTISRATCDPRFRRLVDHHQQRKVRGIWRTCKYYIRHRSAWRWSNALHLALTQSYARRRAHRNAQPPLEPPKHHLPLPRAPSAPHTSTKDDQSSPRTPAKGALAEVLARLAAKIAANTPT